VRVGAAEHVVQRRGEAHEIVLLDDERGEDLDEVHVVAGDLGEDPVLAEQRDRDELGDPEGLVIPCPGMEDLVDLLLRAGLRARVGTIASARRLVVGDARGRLAAAGAIAVDMESAWLAPAAAGRPFAVVRVVVDTPEREVHRPLATANGIFRACAVLRRAVRPLEIWARTASAGATVEAI
jgi:4-hydroxy-3-methylbut-2-en-1-yl diphosphate reductase